MLQDFNKYTAQKFIQNHSEPWFLEKLHSVS